MIKMRMASAKLWKDLMNAVSTLIDEGTFVITEEGISLKAMDPSHVAMVDFMWPKSAFDDYIVEKPTKICVNISEMLKVLKNISKDSIEISIDESSSKIDLKLIGRARRIFSLATLQASEEEVPTPKVQFNVKAKLLTDTFRQLIKDVSTVSDYVKFEADSEKFVASASGDIGSVRVILDSESEGLLSLEVAENSKAIFSTEYLSDIVRAAKVTSETVVVEFSTNMPIRLSFEVPQEGRLQYYLAPRIEQE